MSNRESLEHETALPCNSVVRVVPIKTIPMIFSGSDDIVLDVRLLTVSESR